MPQGSPRPLTLTLERSAGSGPVHQWVLVQVGKGVVLAEDGDKKRSYVASIPSRKTRFELHSIGTAGSKFSVTIDLPGKANDFVMTCTMPATHFVMEFSL
jgi:hypothetical protein